MPENLFVYTRPLLATHSLQERVFANENNAIEGSKLRESPNREYVGKYCLVDWLDDRAVIDCSLIHEWD